LTEDIDPNKKRNVCKERRKCKDYTDDLRSEVKDEY